MNKGRIQIDKVNSTRQAIKQKSTEQPPVGAAGLHLSNRQVQRLLAQRSGQEPFELDEETAGRINRERSGGQPLDEAVQTSIGQAMGTDFGQVRVHTSPESDALNRQIGAEAFTTAQDIFFRQNAYAPHTAEGQRLIAHELTHVAQQGTDAAGSEERMTVGAPDDAFEREANATARTVTNAVANAGVSAAVQRQPEEEEELEEDQFVQRQDVEEEEEIEPPVY
ncbi:MAG: DUF4157 domain-containing protein [Anaerolineae bacterium]|nr:DUF4157 domain-containing protein [Anaerolineae bacterium]